MERGAGEVAVASFDAEDIGNSERGDGVVVVGDGAYNEPVGLCVRPYPMPKE